MKNKLFMLTKKTKTKKEKTMKKLVLFVSFLFIASLCFGQNLVSNPGFENWTAGSPDDWSTAGGSITLTKNTTNVHTGSSSCEVTWTSTSNQDLRSSTFSVTGGAALNASVWIYDNDAGGRARLSICYNGPSGGYNYYGSYSVDQDSWQELSYSGTIGPDYNEAFMQIRFYDVSPFPGSATVLVDDVSFSEVSSNTIINAYAISADELEVFYNQDLTTVAASDFELTGSATITFSTATIDGTNPKLVHLSGASTPMADDNILDTISDEAKSTYDFYAGITSIAYTNTLNPDGTIDNTHSATFKGIVSADNENSRVWVSDASGAYNGVLIFDYSFGDLVDIGDEIIFTAVRDEYFNLTELTNPQLIDVVSTGNLPYGPDLIDGSDIDETIGADTNPAEKWEGQFVKIENFYVDSFDGYNYRCQWIAGGKKSFPYFLVDDQAAPSGYTLNVGSTYQEIIGVVDFNYSHYHINPRGDSDITLPVELSSFTAVYANDFVTIQWATASETDVIGFNIYRAYQDDFNHAEKVNFDLIGGHGTTTQPHEYSFVDETSDPYFTTYYYWLESVNFGGTYDVYGSIKYDPIDIDGDGELNTIFQSSIDNVYPNPVNIGSDLTFKFMIGGLEGTLRPVSLNIYNIRGELVKEIINENLMVDDYTETWNVNDIANGVYFYQLKTENYQETKKLLIQ